MTDSDKGCAYILDDGQLCRKPLLRQSYCRHHHSICYLKKENYAPRLKEFADLAKAITKNICGALIVAFTSATANAANPTVNLVVQILPVAATQTVAALSLTNGPPNLSTGLLAAGLPSGSLVSDIYADMNPMSAAFVGSFAIAGGAQAGNFSITTAGNCGSAGNITCGHLTTNGSLGAGTYNLTINTSLGGTAPVVINVVDGTHVACNTSLPTSGTVLLAPNCTYHWDSAQGGKDGDGYISPASNTTYIGAGNGSTIVDGGGNAPGHCGALRTDNNGATNITIASIQWQNFACPTYTDLGTLLLTRGSVQNNKFLNNGNIMGGNAVVVTNNLFDRSARNAIGGDPGTIASGATMTMLGNEFSNNALTMPTGECGNLASIKLLTVSNDNIQVNFLNNYVHDNNYFSIWFDTDIAGNVHHNVSGNTFLHNSGPAMEFENSDRMDVGFNLLVDNGGAGFGTAPGCPGAGGWASLEGVSGNSWNIHDNNISQQRQSGGSEEKAFSYHQDGRGQGDTQIVFQHNTVTFYTNGGNARVENDTPASGSAFDFNSYFMSDIGDTHFVWGGFTGNFAGLQSQGQEAHGSAKAGDEQTRDHVIGCRHIACTGAGIGPNGLPR